MNKLFCQCHLVYKTMQRENQAILYAQVQLLLNYFVELGHQKPFSEYSNSKMNEISRNLLLVTTFKKILLIDYKMYDSIYAFQDILAFLFDFMFAAPIQIYYMIKSIIEKVILKHFSLYMSGISSQKLQVKVMSGQFSIADIALNHHFFNQLRSPFDIVFSHIGSLTLQAPLTKLSSVPVSCTIEDVHIIVRHKKEFIPTTNVAMLKEYIAQNFQTLLQKLKQQEKEDGYMQKLGKKIVDNLILNVAKIHIRFESPQMSYACGATLKSMTFRTTNKYYQPEFKEQSRDEPFFKLLEIQQFKLYWHPKAVIFSALENSLALMKSTIVNIVNPIVSIDSSMQMQINPQKLVGVPSYLVSITFRPISVEFNKAMTAQIIDFALKSVNSSQLYCRPAIHQDAIQNEEPIKQLCIRFVDLQIEGKQGKLHQFDSLELVDAEKVIRWSRDRLRQKVQLIREKQLKKQRKGWFSKEVELSKEEKLELETLITNMTQQTSKPKNSLLFEVDLRFECLRVILSDSELDARISLSLLDVRSKINQAYSDNQQGNLQIQRIEGSLTQGHETQCLFENIITQDGGRLLHINWGTQGLTPIHTSLQISLSQIQATYRKEYQQLFNKFFNLSNVQESLKNQAKVAISQYNRKSNSVSKSKNIIDFVIDVESPCVILPVKGNSFLYLNLGRLRCTNTREGPVERIPIELTEMCLALNQGQDLKKPDQSFSIVENINLKVIVEKDHQNDRTFISTSIPKLAFSANWEQYLNFLELREYFKDKEELPKLVQRKQRWLSNAKISGKASIKNNFMSWRDCWCMVAEEHIYIFESQHHLEPEYSLFLKQTEIKHKQHIIQVKQHKNQKLLRFVQEEVAVNWAQILEQISKEKRRVLPENVLLESEAIICPSLTMQICIEEISCRYSDKSDSNMLNIQLFSTALRMQSQSNDQTATITVAAISVSDRLFIYPDTRYQSILSSSSLSIEFHNYSNKIGLAVNINSLQANWKPDILLHLINFYQEATNNIKIAPSDSNANTLLEQCKIECLKKDQDYIQKGRENSIRINTDQYRAPVLGEKAIQIDLNVKSLLVHFVNRQTHLPMFKACVFALNAKIIVSETIRTVEGSLKSLQIAQLFNYPQKNYDIGQVNEPFSIVEPALKHSELPLLKFNYSAYEPSLIANQERVDSFLKLECKPLKIIYFQEVFIRLVDYFLNQVVLLLSNHEVIIRNSNAAGMRRFLPHQFSSVAQKFLCPFFTDYQVILNHAQLWLAAEKHMNPSLRVDFQKVEVSSFTDRNLKRFQKQCVLLAYQEHFIIKCKQTAISLVREGNAEPFSSPFSISVDFARVALEDQMNEIQEELKYDNSYKITAQTTRLLIPHLSRMDYQNLMKMCNFNLNFKDGCDSSFTDNYHLAKLVTPRPIQFSLTITKILLKADYSSLNSDSDNLRLMVVAIAPFTVTYRRETQTNVKIEMNQMDIHGCQYSRLDAPPQELLLAESSTPTSINIQITPLDQMFVLIDFKELEIFLHFGLLNLISQWVIVDDWVFPENKKTNSLINMHCTISTLTVNQIQSKSTGFRIKGGIDLIVTRPEGISQNEARRLFLENKLHSSEIEDLPKFMSITVETEMEVFMNRNGSNRRVLEPVCISFTQTCFYRVRKDQLITAVGRELNVDKLKGNISVRDLQHFQQFRTQMKEGDSYQERVLKGGFVEETPSAHNHRFLESASIKINTMSIYLINSSGNVFVPLMRANIHSLSAFIRMQTTITQFDAVSCVDLSYFNDKIFRWEPLLEQARIAARCLPVERGSAVQVTTGNIFINISKQMAISLRKVQLMFQEQEEIAADFTSRYVIRNNTGYTIEIYDSRDKLNCTILTGSQSGYQFKGYNFEDGDNDEMFSFNILHPNLRIKPVRNIPLAIQKQIRINLKNLASQPYPTDFDLLIKVDINNFKKVLLIQSTKGIIDYSDHSRVVTILPFDNPQRVILTNNALFGVELSLLQSVKCGGLQCYGKKGILTIRHKYFVYNFTPIQLKINNITVSSGQFAGIQGEPVIQGIKYQQSMLRVIHNEQSNEYYIYALSYLIDYSGLTYNFEGHPQIHQLYSQKVENTTIYLLPTPKTPITASLKGTKVNILAPFGRQQFSINEGARQTPFASYTYVKPVPDKRVTQFVKIIEITPSYILDNQTPYEICLIQNKIPLMHVMAKQNQVLSWGKGDKIVQIRVDQGDELYVSSNVSFDQTIDTFKVRSISQSHLFKIFSIQLSQTNNITFVHILELENRIKIRNYVPGVKMILFQSCIFEDETLLQSINNPHDLSCNVDYRKTEAFAYDLPLRSHEISLYLELDESVYPGLNCQPLIIEDLENNVFNRVVSLTNSKNEKAEQFRLTLNLDNLKKVLTLRKLKKEKQKQVESSLLLIRIPSISLGIIGIHECLRKQLLIVLAKQIQVTIEHSKEDFNTSLLIRQLRLENTMKRTPYFVTLFQQLPQKSKTAEYAIAVKLIRSSRDDHVVKSLVYSMSPCLLTVTSQEIQVIQDNMREVFTSLEQEDKMSQITLDKLKPPKAEIFQSIYFVAAQIHPFKCITTFKLVCNWGGMLLKALDINECPIEIDGKKVSHFSEKDISSFFAKVFKHFEQGLKGSFLSLLGSIAIIGTPLQLTRKIGKGIKDLVTLPSKGFEYGAIGVGQGLAMGAGSLVKNTFQGAVGTVEQITGSIGNGVSILASYDNEFAKSRQSIKNEKSEHVGEGLVSGGKSIINGLFHGVTGLVTEPVKGASKSGIGGFFLGALKGVSGLVIKPATGIIDATSKTAEGIKNTANIFSSTGKRRRSHYPRPLYQNCRTLRRYDEELARVSDVLAEQDSRYQNLCWAGRYSLKSSFYAFVSYEFILLVGEGDKIEQELLARDIINVEEGDQRVIVTINDQRLKQKLQLKLLCDSLFVSQCTKEISKVYEAHHPFSGPNSGPKNVPKKAA